MEEENIVQRGMEAIKSLLSYMIFPISLPLIFIQEILNFGKEKLGYNRRTLEGKVVVITGASSGIGESLAQTFYSAGCRLILVSRREQELERVKGDLLRSKTIGRVYVPALVPADIGEFDSLPEKCKSIIDIYGYVDILINNAGISSRGSVIDSDFSVFKNVMNINYLGTTLFTKEILKSMVDKKSGQVAFISSLSGKIAPPLMSAYSASKHALQAFSDCLRAEVSHLGINVTTISPGYVKTNISINALTNTGEKHGKMEESIEKGYSSSYCSEKIFKAIVNREKDVLICPFYLKLVIYLRYLLPSLLFFLLAMRAKNLMNK